MFMIFIRPHLVCDLVRQVNVSLFAKSFETAKYHIRLFFSYDLINDMSLAFDIACSNHVVVNGFTRVLFIYRGILKSRG